MKLFYRNPYISIMYNILVNNGFLINYRMGPGMMREESNMFDPLRAVRGWVECVYTLHFTLL